MSKELSSSDWTDIFDRIDATGPDTTGPASQPPSSNEANTATTVESAHPSSAEHACVQASVTRAEIPSAASGGAGPADAATPRGGQGLAPITNASAAPREPNHKIATDDPRVIVPSHQKEIVAADITAAKQHDIDIDVMLGELERVFAGIRRLESGPLTRPTVASKPSTFY